MSDKVPIHLQAAGSYETALYQSALYPCLRFEEGNFYHYFNDTNKRNYTADDIRYFIENK